jgi:hypothetical protein
MQVKFTGCRIEKSEVYNGKTYTVVGVPAPDQFSHPSKYRLQSMGQLGQAGTLIDVTANMQGIVKTKSFFDRNTGQNRQFDETTVLFEVLNAQPHQQPQQQPAKASAQ